MSLSKKWIMFGVAVFLLLAVSLVIVGQLMINSVDQANQAQANREAVLPPVVSSSQSTTIMSSSVAVAPTVSSQVQTTATPLATPLSVPSEEPVIHEVKPAPPESLTIDSANGDVSLTVKVDAMPYNDELKAPSCTTDPDPECPEKAYWVSDTMGVAPASATDNSTYIVGHSWTQQARVFDRLSDYAMTHYDVDSTGQPVATMTPSVFDPTGTSQQIVVWNVPGLLGATMSTDTANGKLTYTVTNVFVAKKVDIGYIYAFQHGTPNTLVVQTCGIDSLNKVDTEYGVVMIGTLTSAQPNS